MPDFQKSVRPYIAPGIKGGWAGANPHVSLIPPQTGDLSEANAAAWVTGPSGAIIGNFAFADVVTGRVTSANPGTGALFTEGSSGTPGRIRIGFVHRDQISLITPYLGGDTLATLPGTDITLMTRGDFWAQFAAGAAVGAFVFASYADGSPIAGNTATAPTTTYAATTTSGSANLTGVGAGAVPGQPITGTGIPAGTYIVSVSGTTAVMSANATASGSITVTATTAAPTQFRVDSLAAAGDIAKISVWG